MSERQEFEAAKDTRQAVLHDAGHEEASTDHMEALFRHPKGSRQGQSTCTGRVRPLSDAEIRCLAVDRVIDAGGEVTALIVAAGSVMMRGRVGCRSQIAPLRRTLWGIPGITRMDLRLEYDIDDL
jgi:hypothetical protein